MMPSPKQTVQVHTPRPPQLLQQHAERGSTSVLISPPPPHVGQPIFLNPLHSGHSTIPPCINLLTSHSRPLNAVARFSTTSSRKVQEKNAPAGAQRPSTQRVQYAPCTLGDAPGLTGLEACDRRVAEWRQACGDVPANTEATGGCGRRISYPVTLGGQHWRQWGKKAAPGEDEGYYSLVTFRQS